MSHVSPLFASLQYGEKVELQLHNKRVLFYLLFDQKKAPTPPPSLPVKATVVVVNTFLWIITKRDIQCYISVKGLFKTATVFQMRGKGNFALFLKS
jgi:hypothetical protein